jgi:hypothetical protein
MKISWIDLQERIKLIFSGDKVRLFKDILEKDTNGWNWILNFDDLRTDKALIVHTKMIFKLSPDQKFLRKLDFLYLKDINCLYKVIRFDDLGDLENSIKLILNDNLFGKNLLAISELLIEPEININKYFFDNRIEKYSIFSFDYTPVKVVIPCQKLEFNFKFNVNNTQDVEMKIKKSGKEKFNIIFSYNSEKWITEQHELNNLVDVIGKFVVEKL